MPKQIVTVFPREEQQARALGERLRSARLRRRIPVVEMASRVGVAPKTLRRLEQGDTSVSLASLIRALSVLGLSGDIDQVGARDETGRRLADLALQERPRRRATKATR